MFLAVMEVQEVIGGLLYLLLAVALLALVLYCCYIKYIHMKYDYIPGPPRASFFLGHMTILLKIILKNEAFHEYLQEWAEEYGPIVRLNIVHRIAICVLSPEGVKEFLMSPQYPKDRIVYGAFAKMFGIRVLGNGLATDCDTNHWHKQRKIMDSAFNRIYLSSLMGVFNDKAEDLMKVLEGKANGETEVNMMDLLKRVVLDIIAKAAFGLELNTVWGNQTTLLHAVSGAVKALHVARIPFFQFIPGNRKVVKEIQEGVRLLRQTAKECIEERLRALRNGEETPSDILMKILENAVQEGQYDEENMLDNFLTFFVAGHETSAYLLAFTIMELGRQPEVLAKLQAEVDMVVGVKRDINCDDLGNLHYLSQVFKEVLRLYPPVPNFVRWTGTETIIEGVKIPANSVLIFSTSTMGRMGKFFQNPLIFDPDRFRKDQPRPYFSFFPFALGPRSCIGQTFALMKTKVLMAKFLQRFEFQLVPPQSFKMYDVGMLRPLDDVVCRLMPHQPSCI
ncbi:cholesterol 24-hydroxylase-like [Eublepharis macularius]|uniref:Cholesterol 24-hydroxylase n=1 Tax=Eublepharis macularius TaxID=481883 RepID=A0AA97IZ62_EUBMA|nr:cholesterol 24-hydroxylase-like [Eublepharis macularius]